MDAEPKEKVSYLPEFMVAAGYILFFCLALTICSTFYYLSYLQRQPVPINSFATSLPPTTPTPHIVPADQQNATVLFKDDFGDDGHGWAGTEDNSKEQVTLGKLLLESKKEGYYAFTSCALCPALDTPFYLQADLSTGHVTDKNFGIYFNYNYTDNGDFLLFQINTEARKYYFYYGNNDGWSLWSSGQSDLIKPFPVTNTLGIYARKDAVEFYVNGQIIDSYEQSGYPFYLGDFGFYVDNSYFQLVVDNLIVTKAGNP